MRPVLFALLLAAIMAASPIAALDVPSATGFVNDRAGMLTAEERALLEQQLAAIEQNTTVEIAVLTIPSLEQESLEMYTNRVFREWGVGKEDIDNGVLLLVVRDDRKVRIEVGYGLEGTITDLVAGLIIRNRIAPAFREGKYYEGISLAAGDIGGLAGEDPLVRSQYANLEITPSQLWTVIMLVLTYMVLLAYASMRIKRQRKQWAWKIGWLAGIGAFAFIFGTLVGFFTLILCFIVLGFGTFFTMIAAAGKGGRNGPGGIPIIFFGGGGSGGGGGFGGFGGGGSGGGGSSGGW